MSWIIFFRRKRGVHLGFYLQPSLVINVSNRNAFPHLLSHSWTSTDLACINFNAHTSNQRVAPILTCPHRVVSVSRWMSMSQCDCGFKETFDDALEHFESDSFFFVSLSKILWANKELLFIEAIKVFYTVFSNNGNFSWFAWDCVRLNLPDFRLSQHINREWME